jgi:hypothetical protein
MEMQIRLGTIIWRAVAVVFVCFLASVIMIQFVGWYAQAKNSAPSDRVYAIWSVAGALVAFVLLEHWFTRKVALARRSRPLVALGMATIAFTIIFYWTVHRMCGAVFFR